MKQFISLNGRKIKMFILCFLATFFITFLCVSASSSSQLIVDKNDYIVKNVPEKCTVSSLISEIEKSGISGNIFTYDNTLASQNEIVTSNYYFKSGLRQYKIIVTGDVYSDGVIDSTDYLLIKNHLRGNVQLENIQFSCADINEDNIINSVDYLSIKAHFLNIKPLVSRFESSSEDSSEEKSETGSDEISTYLSEETTEESSEYSNVITSSEESSEQSSEIDLSEESSESVSYYVMYSVNDDKMGYISGNVFQQGTAGETCTTVCAYSNMYYRFVSWNDGLTTPQRTDSFNSNKIYTAYFEYIGFPTVNINFKGQVSRDEYTSGSITVENCPSGYSLSDFSLQIKGRGNSSWNFAKKSYKIKLSSKQNLLGIGEKARKDWVLISNHCDKSLMRNYFAYSLAKDFDGIDVTLGVIQVQLYFNGEYLGVYMITEEVEVNKGRVNIDTEGTDDNIGFLLEMDMYYSGTENIDYVKINDLYFSIKSDFVSSSQVAYMKDFLTACDLALRQADEDEVKQFCDVDSLIDMYILQEFTKNIDVGWSSFYIYYDKGESRIHFGPVWDQDLAMGNDYRLDNGSYTGIYAGQNYYWAQTNKWFVSLARRTWFKKAVKQRWNELQDKILYNIEELSDFVTIHKEEFIKNFTKWKIYNTRINLEPNELLRFTTYKQNSDHLVNWLYKRHAWLDEYFDKL